MVLGRNSKQSTYRSSPVKTKSGTGEGEPLALDYLLFGWAN
jgi:hypothetical protein